MITFKNGDLLKADINILCHQVNVKGIMGAGIAKQIASKYPQCNKDYQLICETNNEQSLLGNVFFHKDNENYFIANMFSQNLNPDKDMVLTNYEMFDRCILTISNFAIENNLTVGFPQGIGCGIANGNWKIILTILEKYFKDEDTLCKIIKYNTL